MLIDPIGFDQQHYVFIYVRREFLSSVRTSEFDVHPKVSATATSMAVCGLKIRMERWSASPFTPLDRIFAFNGAL
jgi:hypothetical protein